MTDAGDKIYTFTCPECFVSLKARPIQAGARLMCPSCSATIVVPDPPVGKSIASHTDRIIDASSVEGAEGYELHSVAEEATAPAASPGAKAEGGGVASTSSSDRADPGYQVRGSKPSAKDAGDLIAVTCHVCKTRAYTARKNLGKKMRCSECGTVVPVVETPKTQGQMNRPQKIDEERVGEYGVTNDRGPGAARQETTVPFHCRLCETLLRGTLAQVGTEVVCPDCGTKTVVPPPKKVATKAVVGAAAGPELEDYGVRGDGGAGNVVPVVCSLCHSRLMARADQIGQMIQCPDCGKDTVVAAPAGGSAGAVIGVMAKKQHGADDAYAVNTPQAAASAPPPVPQEVLLGCPMCGRKVAASTNLSGREIACPDCGTLIPVPEQKAPAVPPPIPGRQPSAPAVPVPAPQVKREKIVHIGVDCPRCGTRIHATDRDVGKKIPCPDCDTPITIPPPKADAVVEEKIISGAEEYGVSAPSEVVSLSIKTSRAIPVEEKDDPDFDFLDDVEDSEMRWRLQDRSDELGFLGHPGASNRWLGFSLGGAAVFAIPALSLMLFKAPEGDVATTAVTWFGAFISLAISFIFCLAWAALLSVNLVAIVQDTSAGNHVIRNWPEGAWSEQIGESFYVINSCLVSFVPVAILVQVCPAVRPVAMYLFAVGFWLTLPVSLLSMLEAGSVLTPMSGPVMSSMVRRLGAWAWFYLRSFGLLAVGLAMYLAFWRHLLGIFGIGPFAMPLLAPMAVALAMVYARWLGVLGVSVRETMEEDAETEEEG